MLRTRVKAASLVALPALLLGVAVSGVSAARASAPATSRAHHLDKVGSTFLQTTFMRLRSSTGKRLFATVFVDRYSWHVKHPLSDVQIILGKGDEGHNWLFGLSEKDFAFHLRSGRGRLVAASKQLDKFGRLDLALTSRGKSTLRSCGAGVAERITPVRVTGTFVFRSHTAGAKVPWGTVGHRHKKLIFKGRNIIDTYYGSPDNACFNPPPPCTGDVNWTSIGHGQDLEGADFINNGRHHGFLIGDRFASVGGRHGPERDDTVFAPFPTPKAVATAGGGESIAVVSKGRHGVTGSATVTSVGDPQTSQESCDGGSLTEKSWSASFTNGSDPLTLSEDIGGPITQPDSAHASIVIDSVNTQPASRPAYESAAAPVRPATARVIRRTTLAAWRAQK